MLLSHNKWKLCSQPGSSQCWVSFVQRHSNEIFRNHRFSLGQFLSGYFRVWYPNILRYSDNGWKSLSKLMQLQANKPRSATQNAICGERNRQTPKRSTQFFIERAWNREKRRFKKKRSRRSLSRREVDFLVWRLSDRISGLSGKISSQRPPGSPWKKAISPQLLQWSVLTVSGRKPWVHWEALRCEWL